MRAVVFIEHKSQCLCLQSRQPLVLEVQIHQPFTRLSLLQPLLHLLEKKAGLASPAHADHRLRFARQQGHGNLSVCEHRQLLARAKCELFLKGGSLGDGHLSLLKRQMQRYLSF